MVQSSLSQAFLDQIRDSYSLLDTREGLEAALAADASLDDPRIRQAVSEAAEVTRLVHAALTCRDIVTGM